MYCKFTCEGPILAAEVKKAKRTGNEYGQIRVACGDCAHEFFVEPEDVGKKYKVGDNVVIEGRVGTRGFNPSFRDYEILVESSAAAA